MSFLRAAVILAVTWLGATTAAWAADDEAAGIVSAAVREAGHPCAEPVQATRDAEDTQPDREAWFLTCKDARYRVHFIGSARRTEIVALPD